MKNLSICCYAMLLAVCGISTVSAGSCRNNFYCGDVSNKTLWMMQITSNLNSKNGNTLCDVWNWNYGFGGTRERFKQVLCTKRNLAPFEYQGGGSVDIDAFTFKDSNYLLDFHGKYYWRTKGDWTMIRNSESASCVTNTNFKLPVCVISWDY